MVSEELVPCPREPYAFSGFMHRGVYRCCVCYRASPRHKDVPAALVVEYTLLGLDFKDGVASAPNGWQRSVVRLRMRHGLDTRMHFEAVRR